VIAAALMIALAVWLLGRPGVVAQRELPGVLGVVATSAVLLWRPGWVVPVVGCLGAAGLLLVVVRRRRARAVRLATESALLEACELLAADLRAGLTPEAALARAGADWPTLTEVSAAAQLGADVPAAMRALSTAPGCADLRLVAGSWHVAQRSGSALAAGMTRTAARLRQARSSRAVVRAELSSARATARLLAVLPVFSWLMGAGIGGDPVRFLFGSPWGLACLIVGLGLDLVGLWWIDRIALSIEDSS